MAKNKFFLKILFIFFLVLFIFVSYIYLSDYHRCITKNFYLCLGSHKYESALGNYSFRYSSKYPISVETGEEMVKKHFDDKYIEWVNFSDKWYPNAGGDRLGTVIVEKSDYKNIKEYADKIFTDHNSTSEEYRGDPPFIENTIIAGQEAVHINRGLQPSDLSPIGDDYAFIFNGKLYKISFYYNDYYHKLPLDYYQKGKDLILTTFKIERYKFLF